MKAVSLRKSLKSALIVIVDESVMKSRDRSPGCPRRYLEVTGGSARA